jgi:outer membrane protein assembly factor BamB
MSGPLVVVAGTGAGAPSASSAGAAATTMSSAGARASGDGGSSAGTGGSAALTPTAGSRAAAGSGGSNAGTAGTAATPPSGAAGTGAPPATAATNTWRMMGYDHRNWYFNPDEKALSVDNAKQLTELWRFTVSGFPVGSPVIADGKVFAIASGGLYAIDLQTGKQAWAHDDIAGSAAVAYEDGFIYVQTSLPPKIYKLNAANGDIVWGPVMNCYDESSCSGESSPIIVDGTVLFGMENNLAEASFNADDARGRRGAVTALDAASGMLRWRYLTIPEDVPGSEDGASVWSTVAVDTATSTVFATTGNNFTVAGTNAEAFHAIDFKTGARRWVSQVRHGDVYTAAQGDTQTDMDFGANPILAEFEGKPLVAAGDKGGAFWTLDRETGKVLWSRDDLAPSHSATFGGIFINGAFDGRAFYVVSNDPASKGSVLHRLDAKDGKTTWKHAFDQNMWGASSLANGLLFVPMNTVLHVMNAETGEELTTFDTGGTIAGGSPAVAQGRVVVKSGLLWADFLATRANDQIICYGLPSSANSGEAGSRAVPSAAPARSQASARSTAR